ncbi:MAG TPA: FHA domain-containing protein [Actinomycetota bacterium]|nr:FHA domain-containing protein [Actinomycetota bacterium]
MPELVLTSLKFLFLALLYLFVARTVRVIWLDIAGPATGGRRQAVAQAPRARPAARGGRGAVPRSIAVVEENKSPKVLPLDQDAITLGRAAECSVALDDTYVSQLHTKIFRKDGAWFVMDLGSTNGTYLNRMKVSDPMPVSSGDEVRLGKTVVEVRAK